MAEQTTTSKVGGGGGGGKIAADTGETTASAWRHGCDDVSLPLQHGRLLLGLGDDDEEATQNDEHIGLRTGKRSD